MATTFKEGSFYPLPTGFASWQEWAASLIHSLELEGGGVQLANVSSASSGTATLKTVTSSTAVPLLSVRLKANTRGRFKPDIASILVYGGFPILYKILFNAVLTGASFSSLDPNSIVEVDTSATSFTDGMVLRSGYVWTNGSNGVVSTVKEVDKFFGTTNGVRDIMTITGQAIDGTVGMAAAIDLQEFV